MTKKSKKNKDKHLLTKKEFVFNFISLVSVICIGIYFGYRSLYYYSLQNMDNKKVVTLNEIILNNNQIQKDSEGLHRDTDGYYFKGNVTNNYVWFGNRMFRVIKISDDNSVKLISDDLVGSFMWGEESDYFTSNLRYWLSDLGEEHSGVYFHSLPSAKDFLIKTTYTEDTLKNDKVSVGKKSYQDYVTTLTINDFINAGGKNSYLNNGKIYYLLGVNENKDNLYVDLDGSIQSCDSLDGYGIRAVITMKKNTKISSGDGTFNNPYVIVQGDKTNYVDSYIKLGNDNWKVFSDQDGILKLYKYGYINNNGVEVIRNYSKKSSIFDLNDKYNIAYYLNTEYFNHLSYGSFIVDNNYYTGELSAETGYYYKNIYDSYVICKVGLLNIFDYVSNNNFNDYFHMNTTSTIGGIQYNKYSTGLLEEVDVTELKHIVPVISIQSSSIKSGKGSLDNPYVVE